MLCCSTRMVWTPSGPYLQTSTLQHSGLVTASDKAESPTAFSSSTPLAGVIREKDHVLITSFPREPFTATETSPSVTNVRVAVSSPEKQAPPARPIHMATIAVGQHSEAVNVDRIIELIAERIDRRVPPAAYDPDAPPPQYPQ
ncbi:hypothetical protein AcW1_001180 [Taiwanofungus camphoratus]|nr:hypothetical protein AcV5_005095 [Antrodia cinnamomea]KAI0964339.1 hypothetical protein AcW1_001180 [Antrodia cinnamomea]